MTDNEIRIAIAEKCPDLCVMVGQYCCKADRSTLEPLETCDPLTDLNAMHEAEKKWIIGNQTLFNGDEAIEKHYERVVGTFATARQRAEAFLGTFGLWKEDK